MAKDENQTVFSILDSVNLKERLKEKDTGTKKPLKYLPWSDAWAEVKSRFPNATYTIFKDEHNRPFVEDPEFGLMCYTSVTIEGETLEMWLPVMDASNKAMKRTPYSYKVKNYRTNQYEDKWVQAATMFDINKTIMRCLVKNLAMFGLGIKVYADEEFPEEDNSEEPNEQAFLSEMIQKVRSTKNVQELTALWNATPADIQKNEEFINACKSRKDEIKDGNKA